MTVGINKTQGMVIGRNVADRDVELIQRGSSSIEMWTAFHILGAGRIAAIMMDKEKMV